MKKLFLFIVVFVTLSSSAQTSVYHPFPDGNAVWNIGYSFYCWLPPYDIGGKSYSITFSNDTVIGSQSYHKLIVPFMPPATSTCGGGPAYVNVYKGAIRQDVAVRKVFIVPSASNTEQLLYDFNMQVGDTLKGYLSCYYAVVKTVDTVLVGGSYRKRWLIGGGGYSSIYLIEGIGFTYGLIERYPCATDYPDYDITCFRQNGQILYNPYPYTTTNCELITSTNSIQNKLFQISFYPNPANDKLNIAIHLEQGQAGSLLVYDLTGKLVLSHTLNESNDATEISATSLSPGMYIYKLNVNNDNLKSGKLIIIR